jgi:hypothetical protein
MYFHTASPANDAAPIPHASALPVDTSSASCTREKENGNAQMTKTKPFRIGVDYANKADGEKGKLNAEKKVIKGS